MNIMYYVVNKYIEVYDPRNSRSHQWVPIQQNSILLKWAYKKEENKHKFLSYHSEAVQIVIDGYVTDCNHQIKPILISSLTDEGPDGRKWLYIKPTYSSLTEYKLGTDTEKDANIYADMGLELF